MVIGIDGNEANITKRVGIGEYAYELLLHFYAFKVQDVKFRIYLKDIPMNDLPKENENWQYTIVRPRKLWTQIGLPMHLYLAGHRPDVFFTPSHYAPRFCPVPSVISIMDVSYLHFPELFKKSDLYQLKNWTAYSVRQAKKVLTISQASKNDIITLYNIPEERVIVTYPGIKQEVPMNKNQDTEKSGRKYILFVGTLQPRKNIVRLIEAFAKIPQKEHIDLVIVGKRGWMYDEIIQAPQKFGVKEKVEFMEFVSDEALQSLYQHALCFILPSLYEGFGLPVLEAMKNGCPVITSNVSSLPEAGGDAALYINPTNVDDIFSKLQEIINSEKLRKELIEKGYKHIKKFSWENTAKETLAVLQSVAQ